MAIPQSSNGIGNLLRLASLKNVSGRRKVLPGAEFLEDLDAVDNDVSGTSNDMPIDQNIPPEPEGGSLAQSYDVRANEIIPEPQNKKFPEGHWKQFARGEPNQGKFWESLGSNLANYANQTNESSPAAPQSPPIETQETDLQEGIPPVSASQEEQTGILQRLGNGLKLSPEYGKKINEENKQLISSQQQIQPPPIKYNRETSPAEIGKPPNDMLQIPKALKALLGISGLFLPDTLGSAEKKQEWRDYYEDEGIREQGGDPETVKAQKQEELMQQVEKSLSEPWQYSAYGAAQSVADNPILQQEFKKISGVDYEPEVAKQVSSYELAMKGVEDSLNGIQTSLGQQEEAIKQRILNNQTTENDKYYVGLALLMPLLIGGVFGREAGIGALGGAANGLTDVYSQRGKSIREDEATLLDIAKQKGINAEKIADVNSSKAKFPSEVRKNLPPQENEEQIGMREINYIDPQTNKQQRALEILPGFVAKDEFIRGKKGLENMQKAARELASTKSYVSEVDDLTNDIIVIASQLKNQTSIGKIFNSIVNKTNPGVLSKLTENVDFDGRKVNAGLILQEKLGFLANAYAQAQKLGQLDRAAQSHIEKIMLNPTASLASNKDAIDQMLEVRKLAQNGLVKTAKNNGFVPEFLMKEFEDKNSELLNRLNTKAQDKRKDEVMKKIARSGTNYAK